MPGARREECKEGLLLQELGEDAAATMRANALLLLTARHSPGINPIQTLLLLARDSLYPEELVSWKRRSQAASSSVFWLTAALLEPRLIIDTVHDMSRGYQVMKANAMKLIKLVSSSSYELESEVSRAFELHEHVRRCSGM